MANADKKLDCVPGDVEDAETPKTEPNLAPATRSDRITLDDITIIRVAETEVQGTREEIKVLTGMQRRREVEQRIIDADKLDKYGLHNMSMQSTGGKILSIEYRYRSCPHCYVYLHKDCRDPSYSTPAPERKRLPLPHPGATVLLRVKDGKTEEIYRWED